MSTRWARFARGWLTAFVAVLVAALSHTAAGGTTPGAISIALALAFSAMVCIPLAGKKLSVLKLSASVVISQLLFHALFGLSGTSPATMTATGHHGSGPIVIGAADSAAAVAAQGTHDMSWMWIAHAVAAVLTIVALRRGERTLWSLLDFAWLALVAIVRTLGILVTLPRQRARVLAALAHRFIATDRDILLSPMQRRGPPQALSAC
ncbi:hypothetical protein JF66_09620 [Cryobacterium sp. MLB-32]|uniref:hypothetical protein n=1 Tax=Cryobacterium sp. MLB-32 TaxID=1529318 RepID=UPI0004E6DCB4|nr:hypothetical protein [Cryobacterium sp. MLB-32]KFF59700.1 hypothetical protein JF66_09620 [Cryobacterium sp. MLB-32]